MIDINIAVVVHLARLTYPLPLSAGIDDFTLMMNSIRQQSHHDKDSSLFILLIL